jgi:hypothetical protein
MKKIVLTFLLGSLYAANATAQFNILPAKTATTTVLKTPAGTTAQANGLKCNAIKVTLDTTIKVNPNYAYLSLDFDAITGSLQAEILDGTNTVWVFDKAGKQIPLKEKFLKKVSAAMGDNVVNMLTKIAFKLKKDKNIYTIRYRWESKDKRKNLDVLTTM